MATPAEALTGVDEFTARKVLATCERALEVAGVAGVVPTPLDQVSEAAGILETLDIGELPEAETAPRPNWLKAIIGAYAFREKVVFVDRGQTRGRARFTQAHETVHGILPWHHATYTFDDETIFEDTQAKLDAEANLGAGHLIFQGRRFSKEALEYETRLASAIAMSERYGASAHATIRYFTLHHIDEIGLLVCGRFPQGQDGRLPVWFAAESESFRRRFGGMHTRTRATGRYKFIDNTCEPIFSIGHSALGAGSVVSCESMLTDLGGRSADVYIDGWFNRFNVFVMLTPKHRIRRGRRVTVKTVDGSHQG
jgi:Zn-dependent peptidase ImmA (M78 family)